MHISQPELDKRGMTYEELFQYMIVFLDHEVTHLRGIHTSIAINDIKAYPLQIATRIIKMAMTLHSVIERNNDYPVSNIIVRCMADSLSALYLIYGGKDEEIKSLRHYLYIIDGIKGRLKEYPEKYEYDDRISKEEYDKLHQQLIECRGNYQRTYDFSKSMIERLELYDGRKAVVDGLIRDGNWKFKTLGSAKNYYNWKEMYNFLGLEKSSSFFSLLSEFVHGLSTSNLIVEIGETTFEPIYSFATSLLDRLHKFLEREYVQDMEIVRPQMLSVLLDENVPPIL